MPGLPRTSRSASFLNHGEDPARKSLAASLADDGRTPVLPATATRSLVGTGGTGAAQRTSLAALPGAVQSAAPRARGAVAQLGEHHVRNVGVGGSNPLCSTKPVSQKSCRKISYSSNKDASK